MLCVVAVLIYARSCEGADRHRHRHRHHRAGRYRKEFSLPASWAGSAMWLDFEGAFRNSTVWVNGELVSSHECGYTPFRVRLDNITGLHVGAATPNVVTVFVDPDNGDEGGQDHGSGWWCVSLARRILQRTRARLKHNCVSPQPAAARAAAAAPPSFY